MLKSSRPKRNSRDKSHFCVSLFAFDYWHNLRDASCQLKYIIDHEYIELRVL